MIYSPKNITYSKDGAIFTCPSCEKSSTYQIGQLDRDKWVKFRKGWWHKDCVDKLPQISLGSFQATTDDLDSLMEMI